MIKHRENRGIMDLSWARAMILVDPLCPLGERRGSSKRHVGTMLLGFTLGDLDWQENFDGRRLIPFSGLQEAPVTVHIVAHAL